MAPRPTSGDVAATPAMTRVPSNSVTPYMHVELRTDETHLAVTWKVTLLGVVPLRDRTLHVPLDHVHDLRIVPRPFPSRLALGAALLATAALSPVWLTIPLGIAAIAFLILGYVAAIRIELPTETVRVPICVMQRHRITRFLATVNAARGAEEEP